MFSFILSHFKMAFKLIFVVTLYFSCIVGYSQNPKLQDLVLQNKSGNPFMFAGYHAAIEKGFYRDVGIDLFIIESHDAINPITQVLNGGADIGVAGSELIIAYTNKKPIVALASIFQHSPLVLVVKENSSIQTLCDLKNKKIGCRFDQYIEIVAMLQKFGVTYSDYKNLTEGQYRELFFKDKIDAIPICLADLASLEMEFGKLRVIKPKDYGIDFYGDSIFTSKKFQAENPQLIEDFISATLRGWRYAMENRDELVDIIIRRSNNKISRKKLLVEADVVQKLMSTEIVEIGHMNPFKWDLIAKIYQDFGVVPQNYSLKGFLYEKYLLPEPNTFQYILSIIFIIAVIVVIGFIILLLFNQRLRNQLISHGSKLKESDKKLKNITENMGGLIFQLSVDKRGKYEFSILDRKVIELLGIGSDYKGSYHKFFNHIHDADKGLFAESVKIATKSVTPWAFEGRFIKADGAIIWLRVTSNTEINGGNVEFNGVLVDITERKKIETTLHKSEDRFQSIFEVSPMAVAVSSLKTGIYLVVNEKFVSLSGYTRSELIGESIVNIGLIKSEQDYLDWTDELIAKKQITNRALTFRDNEGVIKELILSSSLAEFGDEECAITMILDVTEQKSLELKIKQSQKMTAVGQLADGMAHGFNDVLTAILGATEMLKKRVGNDNDNKELLQIILDAGARASNLTNRLLNFSQQGVGYKQVTDMHELIEDTMTILSSSVDKRISIKTEFNAKNKRIMCAPALLQTALLNLGLNGCDSMPEGGTLTLITRNIELDEKYCATTNFSLKPGLYLQIRVEDTGSGMSNSVLGKIFDPFYTTKNGGEGSGLGLTSVNSAIVEHRGSIKVVSKLGEGSVFTIYLPVSNMAELDVVKNDHVCGEGTILLIEDEEFLRMTGRLLLEDIGYDVITADDGRQGIEVYRERREDIDLVILDMVMPNMNGRDCFYGIHAINPDVKVLIASGFIRENSLEDLFDLGLAGFIWKPFQLSVISKQIAKVLNGEGDDADRVELKNPRMDSRVLPQLLRDSETSTILKLTALIVINDRVFRGIIVDMLKERGYNVDVPDGYDEGMDSVSKNSYSLILADWDLAGKSGIDICISSKAKIEKGEQCYTLVMTDKKYVNELRAYLGKGIDDYLVKPFTLDYFTVRISVAEQHLINFVKRAEAEVALRDVNQYLEGEVKQRTEDLELTNKQLQLEIIERQNAEKEKDQKQAQMVHSGRLAALGEMATAIAHEINQPLNIIQVSADAIEMEINEEVIDIEELQLIHSDIKNQVERMTEIIKNVRSFARQEEGASLDDCDIAECIMGALGFFHEQFRLGEIELVIEFDISLPMVKINSKKFQQVVVNLLLNSQYAIYKKDLDNGGFCKRVVVCLIDDPDKKQVVFKVIDNGCGMSEEVKEKCLDPFFTTKPVDEGTGLGTSIMYGIVKEFGGSIEVDSVVGEGTVFKVFIPYEIDI